MGKKWTFAPALRAATRRRLGAREADPGVGSALRAVADAREAAVCARHHLDDREAEAAARASGARLVATAEALEGVVDDVVGEATPLVGHVQLHQLPVGLRAQLDPPVAVAQRIRDEVVERLRGPIAVG